MITKEYTIGFAQAKPKYLSRWWLSSRPSKRRAKEVANELNQLNLTEKEDIIVTYKDLIVWELYVPWWAKPLDMVWGWIFGKPKLIKESANVSIL